MSTHKFVWPLFLLGWVTAACEEKPAAPPAVEAPPVAEAAKPTAPAPAAEAVKAPEGNAAIAAEGKEVAVVGPQEVCGALIEAAKGKDEAKIVALSTPATGTAFAAQGAKEHILKTFAVASCGGAKVEGDSAIITLEHTTPVQEATFSKGADGWKFDGAAFLAKYPVKTVKEKASKAAAKAHGKAAAKKHHHGK